MVKCGVLFEVRIDFLNITQTHDILLILASITVNTHNYKYVVLFLFDQ
jgi:hypothetical protein